MAVDVASRNPYLEHLGAAPPDLNAALARPDLRLGELMTLAVLEAGRPLPVEAIAERLGRLPLPPRLARGSDPAALRKAWHGQSPLVRDPTDGLFYLDLLSHFEVRHLVYLGRPRVQFGTPAAAEYEPPPDTEPLSEKEIEAAFEGRSLLACSSLRLTAAVLDASDGGPLPLDEVGRRVVAFDRSAWIDERAASLWRTDLVRRLPDNLLELNRASKDVPAMRRAIRRMALAKLQARARWSVDAARIASRQAELRAEQRAKMEAARRTRRALLHVVSLDGVPRAAAVVSVATRERQIFTGEEMAYLPLVLEAFDLLAGVDIRASLRGLGVNPDRWWLAELRPTQKTFRPTDASAVAVKLTGAIQATTNQRGVPADSKTWRTLWAGDVSASFEAALVRETDTLFAFFEYGALHGGVRLRGRAGDRLLPVSWVMEGDPDSWSIARASVGRLTSVELAVGPPAGPTGDPWEGARIVSIADIEPGMLYVQGKGGFEAIAMATVRAIRIADPALAADTPPAFNRGMDDRYCRLTVTLVGIAPPIWRRLELPASTRFERLHGLLQAAMGWSNYHLHTFEVGRERIGIPYELESLAEGFITRNGRWVTLADVMDRGFTRFTYEYDPGDGWLHAVELEYLDAEEDGGDHQKCVAGERACPPEDCGGVGGYEHLLEVLFDPRHPEFEELRQWARGFQPERFDLAEVNRAMDAVSW